MCRKMPEKGYTNFIVLFSGNRKTDVLNQNAKLEIKVQVDLYSGKG